MHIHVSDTYTHNICAHTQTTVIKLFLTADTIFD